MNDYSTRFGRFLATVVKCQAVVATFAVVAALPLSAQAVVGSATNPGLSNSCGLDIALVMDTSASIDEAELTTMKDAFHGFVDALLPGTPTMFSLISFGYNENGGPIYNAVIEQMFTDDEIVMNAAIDGVTADVSPAGATNWQDGLLKAASTFDPRPDNPNLVIFASDGNPTVNNSSYANPGTTDGNDLTNAIVAANGIKTGASTDGNETRIITIGIGSGVNQTNLEAISSADAYYDSDFGSLASTLQDIADDLCGGTITVTKYVDGYPASGWHFAIDGGDYVTDENGQTTAVSVNAGSYDVMENVQEGYTLASASCTNGEAEQGSQDGDTVYGVEVGSQEIISCSFYNETEGDDTATLTIIKVVNGEDATFDFAVSDVDQIQSITTVEGSGSTSLDLVPGTYDVTESVPSGWFLFDSYCEYANQSEGVAIENGEQITIEDADDDVTCYFYNHVSDDGDGDDSADVCTNIDGIQTEVPSGMHEDDHDNCVENNSPGNHRGGGGGGGEVLGVASCGPLLTQYLHIGWPNDSSEVTKLQEFLNSHMSAGLPVDGLFGQGTFDAVETFQVKYGNDVLNPWVGHPDSGITGPNTPTGYVYQTTKWQINNLWCPGSEPFPAQLI